MWQYNYELYHHGILGQKWGVRRYQNPDGSLTEEGKKRYGNTLRRVSLDEYRRDKTDIANDIYQSKKAFSDAMEKERKFWDLEATEPYSEKQGKLWDERNKLLNQARAQTMNELRDYLENKYGEKRVKKFEDKLRKTFDSLQTYLYDLESPEPNQEERDRYYHIHNY